MSQQGAIGQGGGRGGGGRSRAQRVSDLRYNLRVSLEEAYQGVQKTINVPSSIACDTCCHIMKPSPIGSPVGSAVLPITTRPNQSGCSAIMRRDTSGPLPADAAVMMRTGLLGHDCACALPTPTKATEANKAVRCRREMD